VVVTGVFFGLMHTQYDWAGMLAATITGLYLGYVRWQTGSTLLTCSFHAVMNAVATIECVVAVEWMGRA
jgi:membrane protease YdiL (CAAX protease family)